MSEAIGAGDLAVEFGFEVVDGGGAGFDFGNNLVLFSEGWNGKSQRLDVSNSKVLDANSNLLLAILSLEVVRPDDGKEVGW